MSHLQARIAQLRAQRPNTVTIAGHELLLAPDEKRCGCPLGTPTERVGSTATFQCVGCGWGWTS